MAFNTYKVKTASHGGTAFTGIQNWSVSISGSAFDIVGDGNALIEDTFTDQAAADVTITGTDVNQIDAFVQGAGGVLILVLEERVGADGATAGADKTLTFAAASLQSISFDTPSSGADSWSLAFRCAGPAGAAIYAWS